MWRVYSRRVWRCPPISPSSSSTSRTSRRPLPSMIANLPAIALTPAACSIFLMVSGTLPAIDFAPLAAGRIFYWLLDHSEVVRIINARKNVGIFAELLAARGGGGGFDECAAPPASIPMSPCLSRASPRKCAACSTLSFAISPPSSAIKNCPSSWQRAPSRRVARRLSTSVRPIVDAIRTQIEGAGLQYVDLDGRIVAAVGAGHAAELYGFGANLGFGHLNVAGNRVYGEIFADVIAHALPSQRQPGQ